MIEASADVLDVQDDPVFHIQEVQGVSTLQDYQINKILRVVQHYDRVAIKSCHSVGKTFTMARIVLWYGSSYPNCKIITTAPTFRQVRYLLWAEINAGHERSATPLGGTMLTTQWQLGKEWFALGFSPDKDAASQMDEGQGSSSSFQGFHAPYILVVVDEATGVPKQILDQAEGLLTGAHWKIVCIGNPTTKNCEFAKLFKSPLWKKVQITCFDSPNLPANGITDKVSLQREVTRLRGMPEEERLAHLRDYEIVEPDLLTAGTVVSWALEWGIDHPLFKGKALAEFPETSEHVAIEIENVYQAQARQVPAQGMFKLGVDVARGGTDKTCLTLLQGWTMVKKVYEVKRRTTEVSGKVIQMIRETEATEGKVLVDATGIGSGVVDELVEAQDKGFIPPDWDIIEVHFGASDFQKMGIPDHEMVKKRFTNLKAWMFDLLNKDLRDRLQIFDEEVYRVQLPEIRTILDSKGRTGIEPKEKYKSRTRKHSPDDADSLALANLAEYLNNNTGSFSDMETNRGSTVSGGIRTGDEW